MNQTTKIDLLITEAFVLAEELKLKKKNQNN